MFGRSPGRVFHGFIESRAVAHEHRSTARSCPLFSLNDGDGWESGNRSAWPTDGLKSDNDAIIRWIREEPSPMSVSPRLNRLFGADGKCFDVAIDHGFFNESCFLAGIEDIAAAVRTIVA